MKIAVYTIALNEQQFVHRFMNSVIDEADGVYVTDTGSTDGTVKLLRERGAKVNVVKVAPWRFDIPRNISLDFVPSDVDVCVCIDLDEVLTKGWRKEVEKAWTPQTNRLRYKYVWNTLPNGDEGVTFWYDKIHSRQGFRWVKPIHEILSFYGGQEVQSYSEGFKLYHYPDATKSRGAYLPLLELAAREEPDCDRTAHYLGREYMFYGMYEKSIGELKRHLTMPRAKWDAERAASMRFIGRGYTALNNHDEAERWFIRATAESPRTREPWFELGRHYHFKGRHADAYAAFKRMFEVPEEHKGNSYICDPEAWGEIPYDLAGVSAFYAGNKEDSIKFTERAIELNPGDERLRNNLRWATGKVE